MLFPQMLQRGWIREWILMTLLILVLGALSLKKQDIDRVNIVQVIEKEDEGTGTADSIGETELETSNLDLEGMMDRGFWAKEQGNYEEAAAWFLRVLDKNPTPDIQVYIVMDIFEFWHNIGKDAQAKKVVQDFNHKFFNDLPPELQNEFKAWMARHQIG